eukprot:scaffold2261_cov405-Prasinococcus_capsulatus_cf.AAC.32
MAGIPQTTSPSKRERARPEMPAGCLRTATARWDTSACPKLSSSSGCPLAIAIGLRPCVYAGALTSGPLDSGRPYQGGHSVALPVATGQRVAAASAAGGCRARPAASPQGLHELRHGHAASHLGEGRARGPCPDSHGHERCSARR